MRIATQTQSASGHRYKAYVLIFFSACESCSSDCSCSSSRFRLLLCSEPASAASLVETALAEPFEFDSASAILASSELSLSRLRSPESSPSALFRDASASDSARAASSADCGRAESCSSEPEACVFCRLAADSLDSSTANPADELEEEDEEEEAAAEWLSGVGEFGSGYQTFRLRLSGGSLR